MLKIWILSPLSISACPIQVESQQHAADARRKGLLDLGRRSDARRRRLPDVQVFFRQIPDYQSGKR